MPEYAVHLNPVWRDRADFIIHAKLDDDQELQWEQLWVRKISDNRFEVCCIPVFAHNLALGDEVETGPSFGKEYVVQRVVKPSGHYTFRIWFGDTNDPKARQLVPEDLAALQAVTECYSHNLYAVDTKPQSAQAVADYLHEKEQLSVLVYETGRTA